MFCSIWAVQEYSHTWNDALCSISLVGNLESTKKFFAIKRIVDWNIYSTSWMWIRAALRYPGECTNRELYDLVCLTFNVSKLVFFEAATLKPKAFNLNGTLFFDSSQFEARNKFELINSNLKNSCRSLPQGIKERFWVQQVT